MFLLNERKNGFNVGEIRDILKQLNNTFQIMKDKKISIYIISFKCSI